MVVLRFLLFLIPAMAWAQPAAPPSPPQKLLSDRVEALMRSDPELMQSLVRYGQANAPAPVAAQPPAAAPPSLVAAPAQVSQPDPILEQIALAAVPVVGAFLIPLVGWGMAIFQRRTGIEITAEQKAAVYAAVQTGRGIVLANMAAGSAHIADAKEGSLLIKSIASDAIASVPDAVSAQGVTHNQMARLISGAVGNAISADQTVPTVTVVQPAPPQSAPPPLPIVAVLKPKPVPPEEPLPFPPVQGSIA